jgi:hypothetical protein
MAELIHKHSTHVRTPEGETFSTTVCGERDFYGVWTAWLEFSARDGQIRMRTERETTQPTREALDYWASGLEPIYVKGAFARAQVVSMK